MSKGGKKNAKALELFLSRISILDDLEKQRVFNFSHAAKISRGLITIANSSAEPFFNEIQLVRRGIENLEDEFIDGFDDEHFNLFGKIEKHADVLGDYLTERLLSDLYYICSGWDEGVSEIISPDLHIEYICRACSFVGKRVEFLYSWQENLTLQEFEKAKNYLIYRVFLRLKRKDIDLGKIDLKNLLSVFF